LFLKILKLIEILLPAALVYWNGRLKGKISDLETEAKISRFDLDQERIRSDIKAEHDGESDVDIIDDFIDSDPG
jgi:hypothetical protein